jgi:hypothetical protein
MRTYAEHLEDINYSDWLNIIISSIDSHNWRIKTGLQAKLNIWACHEKKIWNMKAYKFTKKWKKCFY